MSTTTHEYETCPRCKGTGIKNWFAPNWPCIICDGRGRVIKKVTITND